jgi:nitrite reductase/ring-hydroxylating ferredoxin subunit
MTHHVVAREDEVPPGTRLRVVIDNQPILVLNIKGELFALADRCPHRGGSLADGILTGLVTSRAPGEICYERAGEILRCPWHQWEFDVRTGRSYCDPKRMRVQHYPISVEPGPAPSSAARVEGPLVAETYPVARRGGQIVIKIG